MPDRAGVQRGLLFPFPKDKASKDKAVADHLASRSNGGPMHYFVKEDGSIHYLDNKGGGKLRFNDLATKLHNEAKRRGKKLDSTPTLEDYVQVFGNDKGSSLFESEQQRLREIYKNANTSINDVDHIDSLGQGGLHYSRNLRELLSSENRSDGARHITDEMRNALMLAQDRRDQISLQGPDVPPELRNLNVLAQRIRQGSPRLAGAVDALQIDVSDKQRFAQMVAEGLTNSVPGVATAKSFVQANNPNLDVDKDFDDSTNELQKFFSNPGNEIRWGLKQLRRGM